ncbi:MAG: hypothetical protein KatS3mg008_0465 [Acidimicrobiales bacterium]|nr:MAG: hypothetical protein KatS3mg008_0465 [Acidimicrobiales bacterium]
MASLVGVLKRAAAALEGLAPPPPGVVILAYHRVGGGSGSRVDLDPEKFRDQVAMLAESARVVTLDEAVEALESGDGTFGRQGEPTVVVTFDDGARDFLEVAFPILAEARVPATLFLATRFVEEQVEISAGVPPVTWSGLRDAVETGLLHVGSHTHSHRTLHNASPREAQFEITESQRLVEERLGLQARHFAYPKAMRPAAGVAPLVEAAFRSASLAGGGVNVPGLADVHGLRRVPVQVDDDEELFRAKLEGRSRLEGALREVFDRIRHRSKKT